MPFKLSSCAVAACLLAASGLFFSAPAQANPFSRFRVGPQVGLFLPTDGKTRDRFGDTWFSFGPAFGEIEGGTTRGRLTPDFAIFYQTRGSGHAFFAPVGVEYRRAVSQAYAATPYVGASANVVITDIRSDVDGVNSRFRTAYGGSLFAGAKFGRSAFIEGRYYFISRVRGFDLSGVNLSIGLRF